MDKRDYKVARPLDILGIIKETVSINEDWSVEEATLHLEVNGKSYVEIRYYDLSKVIEPNVATQEEPELAKFDLTIDGIAKMYSDLHKLVNLPKGLNKLHTKISHENMVCFDASFAPLLK